MPLIRFFPQEGSSLLARTVGRVQSRLPARRNMQRLFFVYGSIVVRT